MAGRLAVIADTHFGRKHRFVPKLSERTFEALRLVLEREFDSLIIAGDVFHTGTPHPTLIAEVMRTLRDGLKGRGCFIIYGNHDVTRIGSAVDPLAQMGDKNITVIKNNSYEGIAGTLVYLESWPVSAKPGTIIERNVQAAGGDIDLAILHGSLRDHPNAPRGDWQYGVTGAKLVVAGHIHAPSLHPAGNYPGSLVPGGFAERHKPGFFVYEGGKLAREELHIPVRFTTLNETQAHGYQPDEGEVLRVSVSDVRRKEQLEKEFRERGARAEVSLTPQSTQVRAEAASISAKGSMSDAYDAYLRGTNGDVTLVEDAKEFFHDFDVE